MKLMLSIGQVLVACQDMASRHGLDGTSILYAVPRGGVPVVMVLVGLYHCAYTTDPNRATHIVDDIIDSGATKKSYEKYGKPFIALIEKLNPGEWIVFPWETSPQGDESVTDNITRLLQFIGEDPKREGLKETPARVVKAWEHWASGYAGSAKDVLKCFADGAEKVDEMVFQGAIPFFSTCEHHMAPFFGVAHIGYVPNGKIIGLSKFGRLVDIFARRLQVQERLTGQIADAIVEYAEPLGVGVAIRARHLCMESRGVQKIGTITYTSALRGVMRDLPEARAEFMKFVDMADRRAGSL